MGINDVIDCIADARYKLIDQFSKMEKREWNQLLRFSPCNLI